MLKSIGLYIFAASLFFAGITHFIYDHGYAAMIPDWMPIELEIVYMTGITEWLLSILLLFPQTRREAGLATALFLVVVLPANIYAAIYSMPAPWSESTNPVILWLRPLLQPLLIWWVLAVSKPSKS